MIPILVTVVVSPAKKGNAPHTPQPIAPKKNNFAHSFLTIWKFFFKGIYVKGKRIKNTTVHLQKANEIGGTKSTPPLATTKLEAIKIGWINNKEKANKLFFLVIKFFLKYLFFIEKSFVNHHKNCYGH